MCLPQCRDSINTYSFNSVYDVNFDKIPDKFYCVSNGDNNGHAQKKTENKMSQVNIKWNNDTLSE